MGTAAEVLVGADGGVSYAEAGTPIPTTPQGALNGAFVDLGFISDDGLTETIGSSSNKIKNWKGDTVREVQTEHNLEYEFTMLQTNADTALAYYGSDPSDGIEGIQGLRGRWVFDVFDGEDILRIVVPDGQVTDRPSPVAYKNSDAAAYRVKVTAYPDDDNKKAFHYSFDGS